MRTHRKIMLAAGLLPVLALPAAGHASGGRGGGGGGTPPPPPPANGPAVVSGVSISPPKVAANSTGSGVVRLNRVADAPVTVDISNDVQNSPNLVTMPTQVTVSAGSASATFPVTAGPGAPGRTFAVNVVANEAPAVDSTAAGTQFFLVPFASTDIIRIAATISRNGDLKVDTTSDTPSALLSARFNGASVPLRNQGGGRWSGQAKVPVSGGDVVVTSDLGGCSAKSPFTPTASHFC